MKIFNFFIILVLLLSHSVSAQKVKIKKGTVYVDKVAMCTVEGQMSVFKWADLTYKSLTGDDLLYVKFNMHIDNNPLLEDLKWFEITFPSSGEMIKGLSGQIMYGEKQLTEALLAFDPPLLTGKPLTPESVEAIAAKYDQTKKLQMDSIAHAMVEKSMSEELIAAQHARDLKKPVKVMVQDVETELSAEEKSYYKIYQDDVYLGRIVKSKSRMNSGTVTYLVIKELNKPFKMGDKSYDELAAAHVEISGFGKMVTMQDKQEHNLNDEFYERGWKLDRFDAQQLIAQYLIAEGYL